MRGSSNLDKGSIVLSAGGAETARYLTITDTGPTVAKLVALYDFGPVSTFRFPQCDVWEPKD